MKKSILFLITLLFLTPGYVLAATHNIHIEWTYDYVPVDGRTLAGYYLYQEGVKICTTDTPTTNAMDCVFESADGTYDFTLTAFCTDGSESPHSIPYTFTLTAPAPSPTVVAGFNTSPTTLTGSTPFTVDFDASSSTGDIAAYAWNFGDNTSAAGPQSNHTYTTAGTFSASLTVTGSDGTTSQKIVSVTTTAPPVAVITPGTFTGDAPLTIAFDGSTSTSASSYAWSFGDGTTATGSGPSHTFTSPGTYTTTLTVTSSTGQTNASSETITVNEATPVNTPPTAVISSSTAMGDAPLTVSFDGSASHDNEGSISSYLWNFGDGSQTTSAAVTSHSYTIAGTYDASLTVTDNQGLTNTTSTPVIITGQTAENQPPTASLTTSTTSGSTPLEVTFDASSSSDPEGSALSYNWNFGDGTSTQGITATHTYTTAGTFTATLTVTDDAGATASTDTAINAGEQVPVFQIELGEIELDHNWITVDLTTPFIDPVVVAGPPSRNGGDPCVVRIRNITPTGFDIRIQEWTYLNGSHAKETVAYIVMEKGHFTLDDGTQVEAGQFTSPDTKFHTINFATPFNVSPIVLPSLTTVNEEDTVTSRLRRITPTSFEHKTQEQQLTDGHGSETVNYIAWEPTNTVIDGINIIVGSTADKVKNFWYNVAYGEELAESPLFLGAMQSQDGRDPAAVRYTNKTTSGIQVMVEEERSKDIETRHTSEIVGFFLFSKIQETIHPENTFLTTNINFQRYSLSIAPGYLVDYGQPFNIENNYGWLSPIYALYDRNNTISPDYTYDSVIWTLSDSTWEMVLPNGNYSITVCVGDADWPGGGQFVQAEGIPILAGEEISETTHWIEKTQNIAISDGKLTLTFIGGTSKTRICWLKVVQTN